MTETVLESAFADHIAGEVGCRAAQVAAASALLADGATVPFVARYRKEVTGGLDDAALERIAERRTYFLELCERRDAVLARIAEVGKLTPELEARIRAARTKVELEDLYLPYRPRRRSRAQAARERGLEPLAEALLEHAADDALDPAALAAPYVDAERDVPDAEAALGGARDILAERVADDADGRAALRQAMRSRAVIAVTVVAERAGDEKAATYRDYFDHREPVARIPSHRMLAILRGEREGVLRSSLELDDEAFLVAARGRLGGAPSTRVGMHVALAAEDGYRRLVRPAVETEVRREARERADAEAIAVFRANLTALLMQSPLGPKPVLGLDPGYRTGCKLAVVDPTTKVLATDTIRPLKPKADEDGARARVVELVRTHGVRAVAVGNGTGGREAERFVRETLDGAGLGDVVVVIVPETGASVYSASPLARRELEHLDVTLRGAVSIARRLQDPLAELVKIDPRSLGVGQYQHDVDQRHLMRELDQAVERGVHQVGVELNSASTALLERVSGLGAATAQAIVAHREACGAFTRRPELLEVPGVGPKTYVLAAGFLRIRDGVDPLDRTAVHPERYDLVARMAAALGTSVPDLVGDPTRLEALDLDGFVDEEHGVGRYTLDDIRHELARPGRDPRPEFRVPEWRDDVQGVEDLVPGMELEGRVMNVTAFGAFVDVGVKRDGLVHVSELGHGRVRDPHEAVQVGDVVRVQVLSVDVERCRVNLSIKALQPAPLGGERRPPRERRGGRAGGAQRDRAPREGGPRDGSSRQPGERDGRSRDGRSRDGRSRDDRQRTGADRDRPAETRGDERPRPPRDAASPPRRGQGRRGRSGDRRDGAAGATREGEARGGAPRQADTPASQESLEALARKFKGN